MLTLKRESGRQMYKNNEGGNSTTKFLPKY